MFECAAFVIGEAVDFEATVEFFSKEEGFEGVELHFSERGCLGRLVTHRAGGVLIPVELHPDIL
jgi:hypothetical protein